MSKHIVLLVCLTLTLAIVQSCSPRLEERVKAFEKAYNEHDVETIVAFYAQGAAHEVPGVFRVQGMKELTDLTAHDVALNTKLSFVECTTVGDTVICELTFESDWTRTAHMGEVRYSGRLVFRDGLITEFVAKIGPEGAKAFSDVYGPFLEWASTERPEQLAKMMNDGVFVYNAENGKNSLTLLREWQEETGRVH